MLKHRDNKILQYDYENQLLLVTYTEKMTDEDFDLYEQGLIENQPFLNSQERVDVLADVSKFKGLPNEHQRQRIQYILKNVIPKRFEGKTALIGVDVFMRIAARAILVATRKHDIKLFSTREEAIKWLKE